MAEQPIFGNYWLGRCSARLRIEPRCLAFTYAPRPPLRAEEFTACAVFMRRRRLFAIALGRGRRNKSQIPIAKSLIGRDAERFYTRHIQRSCSSGAEMARVAIS